ncbi:hypothetical protein, partial [Acetobacter tropicalis]|uniref:hypothetical protein n=1 Tax=Acetobacter tropicalis TaxID=104102 RepID=UPI00222E897B
GMGQFSVEIYTLPGSVLGENQQKGSRKKEAPERTDRSGRTATIPAHAPREPSGVRTSPVLPCEAKKKRQNPSDHFSS